MAPDAHGRAHEVPHEHVALLTAGAIELAFASAAIWAKRRAARTQIAAEKQVFDQWCTACNNRTGRLPGTASLEDRADLSSEMTAIFVRTGISLMPPFRKIEISDGLLSSLGAYLSAPLAKRKELSQ